MSRNLLSRVHHAGEIALDAEPDASAAMVAAMVEVENSTSDVESVSVDWQRVTELAIRRNGIPTAVAMKSLTREERYGRTFGLTGQADDIR